MSFLFFLALRNLGRNLRRTVITATAVVFGVAIMIIGWGLVDGLDENVLRAARTTMTGDVLLRPKDFPTDGLTWPADQSATPPALTLGSGAQVTARAMVSGRIVHGQNALRGIVLAYDPTTETKVFDRADWKLEGAWPKDGEKGVVLGYRLGTLLDAKIGDEVIVEARTKAGAINALTFPVVGLVRANNGQVDGAALWMPMPVADELVQLAGARTHVAIRGADVEAVRAQLTDGAWVATSTREEVADLIALNNIRRNALTLLVVMIMGIAATGIANTVIMAAFERVREIGTLLSLGMKKAHVRLLFLMEGAAMGLVAGLIGAVVGSVAVLHWQQNGIDVGGAVESVGSFAMSAVLYTQFSLEKSIFSLCVGVLISVLASVWPARIAADLNPADAVRAD